MYTRANSVLSPYDKKEPIKNILSESPSPQIEQYDQCKIPPFIKNEEFKLLNKNSLISPMTPVSAMPYPLNTKKAFFTNKKGLFQNPLGIKTPSPISNYTPKPESPEENVITQLKKTKENSKRNQEFPLPPLENSSRNTLGKRYQQSSNSKKDLDEIQKNHNNTILHPQLNSIFRKKVKQPSTYRDINFMENNYPKEITTRRNLKGGKEMMYYEKNLTQRNLMNPKEIDFRTNITNPINNNGNGIKGIKGMKGIKGIKGMKGMKGMKGTHQIAIRTNQKSNPTPMSELLETNILVKPARKPSCCFLPDFPEKAYSHPYKYDLQVHVPSNFNYMKTKFRLKVSKTGEYITQNHKKKKAIRLEKTSKHVSPDGLFEIRAYRVVFQVCSFHYQRSSFQLECYLLAPNKITSDNDEDSECFIGERPVFISSPFEMFARKNKKSDKEWPNEKEATLIKERIKKQKEKMKLQESQNEENERTMNLRRQQTYQNRQMTINDNMMIQRMKFAEKRPPENIIERMREYKSSENPNLSSSSGYKQARPLKNIILKTPPGVDIGTMHNNGTLGSIFHNQEQQFQQQRLYYGHKNMTIDESNDINGDENKMIGQKRKRINVNLPPIQTNIKRKKVSKFVNYNFRVNDNLQKLDH